MKVYYSNSPIIINDFLSYISKIKNFSSETILNYKYSLIYFFKFIKKYKELEISVKDFNIFILLDVKSSDIIAFLVYLSINRNNNAATRKKRLSSIKSFYNWLFIKYPNYCSGKENPTKVIPNPKIRYKLPKYLTLEQSKILCNIYNENNSNFYLRNNTIIFMFLNTGLRLSELINLNIGDINFDEKYLRIIGKGNKERIVFINEATKEKLLKYLKTETKESINLTRPLFLNNRNNRIGKSGITNIIKKAYKLAGLNDNKYTIHTLRHTAAVIMYNYVKGDILLIKNFLGHESLESTQIYTHLFNEKIKNAFYSNPLSNYQVEREGE